jgi:tyrosinase
MTPAAAGAMAIRERKDVWKLAAWDEQLVWYAKAVEKMRSRPVSDPTSWDYQAAIHGYDVAYPAWAAVSGKRPVPADQKRHWKQCQHATWYFLPWHRMYLAFFEQIVAATVVGLGGSAGWSLPFWNYSNPQQPQTRRLPQAFTDTSAPFAARNPLFEPTRDLGSGQSMPAGDVLLSALGEDSFVADLHGGSSGFGGRQTGFNHSVGRHGQLEQLPHDMVHVDVGGLMGDPVTAALDPIFWLHHANIDRLWEVWLAGNAEHLNPGDSSWLDFEFYFHAGDDQPVSMKPAQVLDTRRVLTGYTYEGVHPAATTSAAAMTAKIPGMTKQKIPPEMVGATASPLELGSGAQTLQLGIAPASGPTRSLALAAAGGPEPDTFLNFENVTATGSPPPVDVYLNLPEGEAAEQHQELRAGALPLFGVAGASVSTEEHSGDGLHYVFKVSELVEILKTQNRWNPKQLRITLVPRKPLPPGCRLKVGRISLYVQGR